MGLFGVLFGTPTASNDQPSPDDHQGSVIKKGVESSFPVVLIKRTKVHEGGGHVQVYCHIANEWPEEVELDKIRIFDTKRELDTILPPHGEREFLVYDGPALQREYHEVQLDYKTRKEGDYFRTIHTSSFSYRPEDKTFIVSSITLHEPVQDIYG